MTATDGKNVESINRGGYIGSTHTKRKDYADTPQPTHVFFIKPLTP